MATAFPYLTITGGHDCGRSLLSLWGELDAANRADLCRAIRATLDLHRPHLLVLDLSALSFADCAGLAVIAWAHQYQQERGHRLLVTGVQPVVRRLMQLTGLAAQLDLEATGEATLPHLPG